jgi:hypothetical protein
MRFSEVTVHSIIFRMDEAYATPVLNEIAGFVTATE